MITKDLRFARFVYCVKFFRACTWYVKHFHTHATWVIPICREVFLQDVNFS